LLLLVTVVVLSFSVGAQKKAAGRQQILDTGAAPSITEAVSSKQCQNGKASAPVTCFGTNYATGSLNRNNSHYAEGDSIPYQIILTAPANSTGNTVQLVWETTKSGVHAFDYLTSYDRTEKTPGNDPCAGTGADCTVVDTEPIVLDSDFPKQLGGQVYTIFGGSITSASAYTVAGTYPSGTSTRSVIITYAMGTTGTAVLAVGAHVSTRQDWGAGFGAVNIQGSPFHFLAGINGTGNQLQVSVGAVTAAAVIRIVKLVNNGGLTFQSSTPFPFTSAPVVVGTTSPLPATFSLIDSDPLPDVSGASGLKAVATTTFGTAFTVAETQTANGYTFAGGSCVVDGAGFTVASTATMDAVTSIATISLGEGNVVTCTYNNSSSGTTAANVTIAGRVTFADGRGVGGARVVLMDAAGTSRSAVTNRLGYYTFSDVETGHAYIMSASAKQATFTSKLLTVVDALGNVDFSGN